MVKFLSNLDKEIISKTVPMVIEISATLKTGHILKSMKSMTYLKFILSIRLPNAPDIIRIKPRLQRRLSRNFPLLIAFIRRIPMIATAAIDTAMKKYVLFLKSPKAIPVFFTNVICRISFIIGIDWPVDNLEDMTVLETWSIDRIKKMERILNKLLILFFF